ncbi:MAG: hypothetical protein ACE14L_14985 [Terriglobales bacterium]
MNSPELLARSIEEFLADAASAVVFEDGALVFDFSSARCSIRVEHGKCVLHLWSAERNAVRRVIDAEVKKGSLRLTVMRFGQAKPSKLEICREQDRRSATQRRSARTAYQQRLRTILERRYAGWTIDRLTSEMDLERSFSPVYARGLLRQGGSAFAVLGVNAQESQAAIDGALTFGILWLDYCRERAVRAAGRTVLVEGLKLFVPQGKSAIVRERLAHLEPAAAKWQLYEFDEREGAFVEMDTRDRGNIDTRLVQCPDDRAVRERFSASRARILAVVPEAETAVLSSHEIAFRIRGLEFARARLEPRPDSFRLEEQVVFGTGPGETLLDDTSAERFANFISVLRETRFTGGPHNHPLWRTVPERWLESMVIRDVSAIDDRLDAARVYSQVPAFAASDRALIDVLATTRGGRLAVLELKADEDIHLPLQGVDYWARVEWHRARGEFGRFGYFPGRELAAQSPLLLLVAPALHIHPATDTLLRYLSPEIDCTLVGIDERWREHLRVVFRKRAQCGRSASASHVTGSV